MKKLNLRSRVKLTGAMTLLACLFFLAGTANAIPIYNNIGESPGFNSAGVDPLMAQSILQEDGTTIDWGGGPLFNSFSIRETDYRLWGVHLLLKRDPGFSAGSFSVALYYDSSTSPGTPGTPLTTIATLSDSALSETLSVLKIPLDSYILLTAHTRYWLVLASTDPGTASTANWSWSWDQDALGVAGEYHGYYAFNDKNWVWGNSDGAYQMRLVPLPGAVWLLGTGLAGLGLWRGRKLFKKA